MFILCCLVWNITTNLLLRGIWSDFEFIRSSIQDFRVGGLKAFVEYFCSVWKHVSSYYGYSRKSSGWLASTMFIVLVGMLARMCKLYKVMGQLLMDPGGAVKLVTNNVTCCSGECKLEAANENHSLGCEWCVLSR